MADSENSNASDKKVKTEQTARWSGNYKEQIYNKIKNIDYGNYNERKGRHQ